MIAVLAVMMAVLAVMMAVLAVMIAVMFVVFIKCAMVEGHVDSPGRAMVDR